MAKFLRWWFRQIGISGIVQVQSVSFFYSLASFLEDSEKVFVQSKILFESESYCDDLFFCLLDLLYFANMNWEILKILLSEEDYKLKTLKKKTSFFFVLDHFLIYLR